jgi:capsular polysaccharide transport system permease protein
LTRNTVAEPARTNSLVPDAVDRARNVSKFLDRVAGVVVEAQAGGRSLSDRAREGRTLVGTVLRRRRISPLAWSAILAILMPTLVGAVYYGLIASNQYASDVRFSIRGNDTSAADLFSGLSGMLGTSKSLQDSYLVSNYLTSREVVEDIEKKVPLRAMYTKSFIDYLSRLETDAPIDDLVEYWQDMVTVSVDETSNTVLVEIRAFSAEDAKAIGDALVEASESLLNRISDRAREDAMRTSLAMSKDTEKRVLAAREAFRQFRDQQGNLDPVKTAESMLGMVSSLTQAKLLLEQDLATRRSSQGPNSPVVINLQTKLKTIEDQIRDFRSQVTEFGRTDQSTISAQLSRAEALRLEQEYAEKTHASSLAAVDMARTEADRSRLFIVPFVRPAAAEEHRYPDRPLSVLTVFLASAALWAIGTLIVYGVRDHMV